MSSVMSRCSNRSRKKDPSIEKCIRNYQRNIQIFQDQIDDLLTQLNEERKTNNELQEKYAHQIEINRQAQSEIEELRKKNLEFFSHLYHMEPADDTTQVSFTCDEKYSSMMAENSVYKSLYEDQNQKIEQLKNTIESKDMHIEALKQKHKTLEQKINSIKQELNTVKSKYNSLVDQQKHENGDEINRYKAQIQMNNVIMEIEKKEAKTNKKYLKMKDTAKKMQVEILQLNNTIDEKETQIEQLKSELILTDKKNTSLKSTKEKSKIQLSEYVQRINELQRNNTELENTCKSLMKEQVLKENEISQLQNRPEKVIIKKKKYREALKLQTNLHNEELSKINKEHISLKSQIEFLGLQINTMQSESFIG